MENQHQERRPIIYKSRAQLVQAGITLSGRGVDVAILQDQRKLAILEKALNSYDLTALEALKVTRLSKKLGSCGKEAIDNPHPIPHSSQTKQTSFRDRNITNESRRILIDRVSTKVRLSAKMCKSFACARCAVRAAGKKHAKLVPIATLLTTEKTNYNVLFLTLQGTQSPSMSINERLDAAESAIAKWRKLLDMARTDAARKKRRPNYGSVTVFEAQIVDRTTKPWIKPHYHILFACNDRTMFINILYRLKKILSPAERRVVKKADDDIKRVIAYMCKENYAGTERDVKKGHSESIHETKDPRILIELAELVDRRRGRPNMHISGVLRDAKPLLDSRGINTPKISDSEWIDIGPAPNGHLDILAVSSGQRGKIQNLIDAIPTADQAASIKAHSNHSQRLKMRHLEKKRTNAESRYRRSNNTDVRAQMWIQTLDKEIQKIRLEMTTNYENIPIIPREIIQQGSPLLVTNGESHPTPPFPQTEACGQTGENENILQRVRRKIQLAKDTGLNDTNRSAEIGVSSPQVDDNHIKHPSPISGEFLTRK